MQSLRITVSNLFLRFSSFFGMLYELFARESAKMRDFSDEDTEHNEEIKKITTSNSLSFESFVKYPREQSKLVSNNSHLQEIVEVYLYAKQCIALYEARTKLTPLQVFNELRSALDHFIRALMSNESGSEQHYKSMLGHIQRAFLDSAKMTCAALYEQIEKKHKMFGKSATFVAAGGVYAENIDKLIYKAEQLLLDAKINEHKLGAEKATNQAVRDKYIHAICAFNIAAIYQQDNTRSLCYGLFKNGSSVLAKIFYAACGSAVTYIFRSDIDTLIGLLNQYISSKII